MFQVLVKQLLKKYNVCPSKRLGQNFLTNNRVLEKIIKAAELKSDDFVLEIGPGIGNLTLELAKRAKTVVAIEKDLRMVEILKKFLDEQDIKNVQIIQDDVLKIKNLKLFKNSELKLKNYKVVANLPYYITSPVIRKFLEMKNKPELMILMVQKEVAQRITAQPPDMNLLAVSVQFYVHPPQVLPSAKFGRVGPEIISYVSKKCFFPQPKVDSAIIKISNIKKQKPKISTQLFFRIVKAGFSHPRKQLLNNLSEELKSDKEKIKFWLLKNNIQPNQRAETLSVDDWINLAKSNIMK